MHDFRHQTFIDSVSALLVLAYEPGPALCTPERERNGGKESIPGRPVVWRTHSPECPVGYVLQEGEDWKPENASRLSDMPEFSTAKPPMRSGKGPVYSPETANARIVCDVRRERAISARIRDKGY